MEQDPTGLPNEYLKINPTLAGDPSEARIRLQVLRQDQASAPDRLDQSELRMKISTAQTGNVAIIAPSAARCHWSRRRSPVRTNEKPLAAAMAVAVTPSAATSVWASYHAVLAAPQRGLAGRVVEREPCPCDAYDGSCQQRRAR